MQGAKERFEETRKAVKRLDEVHLMLMHDCEDWKPPNIKSSTETSDPTANRAIYNVDELAAKLDELRKEEKELTDFIGVSLVIICAVRDGFGEIYANLLEWHYIDGRTWTQISDDEGIKRSNCYYLVDIAFDWIDSIGVSRLIKGETDV